MTLEEQIKALLEAKEKDDEKDQDQADRVDDEPAVKIENPMTPGMQSSEISPQGEIAAADQEGEEDEKEEDEKEKMSESTYVDMNSMPGDEFKKEYSDYKTRAAKKLMAEYTPSEVAKTPVVGKVGRNMYYYGNDHLKDLVSVAKHATAPVKAQANEYITQTLDHMREHHGPEVADHVESQIRKLGMGGSTYSGSSSELPNTKSNLRIEESISDLLGDEFSEEFKLKAQTIFEAAVKEQVTKYKAELQEEHNAAVAKLEEKFEEKFLTRSKHLQEETSDKIDGYLNFLAEEWKKENQVALEAAIKSELTESFISNLKTLFEQHYVDLPEERVDVYAKVVEEKSQMESALATTVSKLKTLTEELHQIKRDQIIEESAKDFSSMDRARFKTLTEDFAFEDASSFKTKVGIVKKSFFGQKSIAKEHLTEELTKNEPIVESSEPVQIVENTVMSAYLKALPKKK